MITFALEESDQQDLICLASDLGPRSVFVSMAVALCFTCLAPVDLFHSLSNYRGSYWALGHVPEAQ